MLGILKRQPQPVAATVSLAVDPARATSLMSVAEYHAFQSRMCQKRGDFVEARHLLTDAAEELRPLGAPARFETPQCVDDWIALKRSGAL